MPVFRVVTVDEVLKVFIFHGVFLESEVGVGTEVVDPDVFCLCFGACWLFVKEDDVCFDTLFVEDSGREPEDGVEIGGLEEFFADGFSCSAFEEYVIGDDNGCFAGCFENGVDVLDEVELFVGAGGPEV